VARRQNWGRRNIDADTQSEVLPTAEDVEAAAIRLDDWLIATPVLENAVLNERSGCRIFVKAESLQHGGSFKIRGAMHRMLRLSHAQRQAGVVAYSSGNHAQGVAMAARWLGVPATIVMPEDAPAIKLANTRALGAEVVLYDRYREDREQIAADIAVQRSAALVPAFDHADVIAGQGTVGIELAQYAESQRVPIDAVFAPCGGGGLIAGVSLGVTARFPECRMFAVEPAACNDTELSLDAGARRKLDGHPPTICDALMAPMPGAITFAINRNMLEAARTVSDEAALHAMAFAARYLKLVLEPSGAVALAAVLNGAAESYDCAGVILSGANVDLDRFVSALNQYPEP
jgi:threonine dehydratase